jgi:aminoglycoside phosphotransferase (APT) family kinase protein
MLVSWSEADDPPERQHILGKVSLATALPGFWSRDEVVAEYARQTGRDLSAMGYHLAMAFYKMAVVSQGIYGRYLAGVTRGEGFEEYEQRVQPLAEMALTLLQGRSE